MSTCLPEAGPPFVGGKVEAVQQYLVTRIALVHTRASTRLVARIALQRTRVLAREVEGMGAGHLSEESQT